MLAEILHHVVALGLAVNQNIKSYFLLDTDGLFNLILKQCDVLILAQFALLELAAP